MTLLLCILLILGTAAGLWLSLEWRRPICIDRDAEDYDVTDKLGRWRQ